MECEAFLDVSVFGVYTETDRYQNDQNAPFSYICVFISVFEKLCFDSEAMWTQGKSVEVLLRFHMKMTPQNLWLLVILLKIIPQNLFSIRKKVPQQMAHPVLAYMVLPPWVQMKQPLFVYLYLYLFHISYHLRRVALRQKPFFKGPSDKNLITIYN